VLRSWVTAGSLDAGGRYRDRNFGELPDYLVRQGKEVWTIPLYFSLDRSLFAQINRMSQSGYRFILPEQYLSIWDIVKTLRDGVRALFPDLGDCELDGRKLHRLVTEIHRSVSLHPSYLSYNSVRYLLEKFAERHIRIDCFIYPAENNPPEKSFILAVRKHYPEARLIGFQHTAWLKEQMGVFLLPDEHAYHPLPEKLVCSGRRYLDILRAAGFPPEILVRGPNLRYAAVRSMTRESSPNGDRAPRKLLVILNYDTNQNMELLDKTGQALKGLEDFRVFIKAHPTTDTQKMSGFLQDIGFPAYEWADGTVQDWLARVDAVVMTGGSVSSIETIAAGVPLVRVSLENNFDFDCLWDDYPVSPPASSPGEIRRHLGQALRASTEERMRLIRYGKEMVENYFEPVTPETLQVFL
jgi:surface carbohydrate biosynthesis protein (TIGR04326 family)